MQRPSPISRASSPIGGGYQRRHVAGSSNSTLSQRPLGGRQQRLLNQASEVEPRPPELHVLSAVQKINHCKNQTVSLIATCWDAEGGSHKSATVGFSIAGTIFSVIGRHLLNGKID